MFLAMVLSHLFLIFIYLVEIEGVICYFVVDNSVSNVVLSVVSWELEQFGVDVGRTPAPPTHYPTHQFPHFSKQL